MQNLPVFWLSLKSSIGINWEEWIITSHTSFFSGLKLECLEFKLFVSITLETFLIKILYSPVFIFIRYCLLTLSFFSLNQNKFASKVFINLGRDVTCEIRFPLSMKIWSSIVNPTLSPDIYLFLALGQASNDLSLTVSLDGRKNNSSFNVNSPVSILPTITLLSSIL